LADLAEFSRGQVTRTLSKVESRLYSDRMKASLQVGLGRARFGEHEVLHRAVNKASNK